MTDERPDDKYVEIVKFINDQPDDIREQFVYFDGVNKEFPE